MIKCLLDAKNLLKLSVTVRCWKQEGERCLPTPSRSEYNNCVLDFVKLEPFWAYFVKLEPFWAKTRSWDAEEIGNSRP